MDRIPLSEFLHISRNASGNMEMEFGRHAHNHIRTAHASAQYALAEIGTGSLLADLFPGRRETTLAVLRRGELKYGKGATSNLVAVASLTEEARQKLTADLTRRGRALVTVQVDLVDAAQEVVTTGSFVWYLEERGGAGAAT